MRPYPPSLSPPRFGKRCYVAIWLDRPRRQSDKENMNSKGHPHLSRVLMAAMMLGCLTLLPAATAQDEGEYSGGKQGVVDRFNQTGLKVGDPLPDIQCFDAEGKPFKLSELKGQPTLIAFGCLT